MHQARSRFIAGWRLPTRPPGLSHDHTRRPGKRSATRCHQARSRFIAGWRLAPTRPTGASQAHTS
ncbi:hypothetical protein J4734_07275 [Klebsiella pneumoniae]|uniref:Uncharacterized protein n=1 Tax=Klebsiella pneumoniae TaxID=573 RepID=A0A939NPL1_KLEPN|nr:hypothetical protein [Klebsiella pneumoniae]